MLTGTNLLSHTLAMLLKFLYTHTYLRMCLAFYVAGSTQQHATPVTHVLISLRANKVNPEWGKIHTRGHTEENASTLTFKSCRKRQIDRYRLEVETAKMVPWFGL